MKTITKYHNETLKNATKLYEWDFEGRTFRYRQDEEMNIEFRVELFNDGWTRVEFSDEYEIWTIDDEIPLDKD